MCATLVDKNIAFHIKLVSVKHLYFINDISIQYLLAFCHLKLEFSSAKININCPFKKLNEFCDY